MRLDGKVAVITGDAGAMSAKTENRRFNPRSRRFALGIASSVLAVAASASCAEPNASIDERMDELTDAVTLTLAIVPDTGEPRMALIAICDDDGDHAVFIPASDVSRSDLDPRDDGRLATSVLYRFDWTMAKRVDALWLADEHGAYFAGADADRWMGELGRSAERLVVRIGERTERYDMHAAKTVAREYVQRCADLPTSDDFAHVAAKTRRRIAEAAASEQGRE